MTFTIIARDPSTGELGVGSFSFALAVGAGIAHHDPSAGVVVIQARGVTSWSTQLLAGLSAAGWQETLDELRADRRFAASQLGALSVQGEAFQFTGPQTERYAEAACRPDLCCVSNLMFDTGVPASAADHFAALVARHPSMLLAQRLVETMRHADRRGGDVRGRMSAFVRTFPAGGSHPGTDSGVDLRVDFHPDPVNELVRLVRIHQAHQLAASAVDDGGAYTNVEATSAATRLAPESAVVAGAHLLALIRAGDIAEARNLAHRVRTLEPGLPERLRRLEEGGRIPTGSLAALGLADLA